MSRQHQRGNAGHQRCGAGGAAKVMCEQTRLAGGRGHAPARHLHAEIGVAIARRRADLDAGAVVGIVAALRGAGQRRHMHQAGHIDHVVDEAARPGRPGPAPCAVGKLPAVGIGHIDIRLVQDRAVLIARRPQKQDAAPVPPTADRQLRQAVDDCGGKQEARHAAPGIGQHVHLVGNKTERGEHLRIIDQQRRALRLPLDRQQPACGCCAHRKHRVCLARDDTGAGGAVVGASLVHPGRLGVDIAAGHQAGATEIAPGSKLAGRIEVGMIELAAVVGHPHHHLRAAEAVEQLPRRLAARIGARVDLGMKDMAVQMPLAGVVRIARRRQLVLGDQIVEVVLGQLDARVVFGQLDHQLHRVLAGVLGELKKIVALGVALAQQQAVAPRKLGHLIIRQHRLEGDKDAVGDQEILTRIRHLIGVMRRPQ